MNDNSVVVYDLEIVKGILSKGETAVEGIEYCAGWNDHANMGISVLGAYDYMEDRYRVFCEDNVREFYQLLENREMWVHFNGNSFDNKVIEATWGVMPELYDSMGHEVSGDPPLHQHYDILVELWAAAGLGPVFQGKGHDGYNLDATCQANLGYGKTGNGALAPVLWQQGNVGQVVDYCLTDVHRTKKLFDLIRNGTHLVSPKTGELLLLRIPFGVAA